MSSGLIENGNRFSGLADIYNSARPSLPEYPVQLLTLYFRRKPGIVVDIGCGTGLSTSAWLGHCHKVIGVEPNGDMLRVARLLERDNVSFVQAYSHQTGLPDESVDIVVCSQSFHWMEPDVTLSEVHRILTPNGIFATIDYDWPPILHWHIEKACGELHSLAKRIEKEHAGDPDTMRRDKAKHLESIRNSALFRYAREIVFANKEQCTADRLYAMALSQSSLQFALKRSPAQLEPKLAEYKALLFNAYGQETVAVDFCYRMRIGVK